MNSNSDDTTGFLEEISFYRNFSKSIVLILHYQLPFFQNGRLPGKMNWTGVQLDLASWSSVLEFETHLKMQLRTAQGLSMEYWSAIGKLTA